MWIKKFPKRYTIIGLVFNSGRESTCSWMYKLIMAVTCSGKNSVIVATRGILSQSHQKDFFKKGPLHVLKNLTLRNTFGIGLQSLQPPFLGAEWVISLYLGDDDKDLGEICAWESKNVYFQFFTIFSQTLWDIQVFGKIMELEKFNKIYGEIDKALWNL